MIYLFNDPEGKNVFKKMKGQAVDISTTSSTTAMMKTQDEDNEIAALKKKIISLENKLKDRDN